MSAVAELLAAGAVDALASDYVPASLVEAAFHRGEAGSAARAIALITATPARMAGLADRGTAGAGAARRPGAGARA